MMAEISAQAFLSAAIRSRLINASNVTWPSGVVFSDHAPPQLAGGEIWLVVTPVAVVDEPVTTHKKNVTATVEVLVTSTKTEMAASAEQDVLDLIDHAGRYDTGGKDELELTSLADQEARDSWVITSVWETRDTGLTTVDRDKGRRFFTRVVRFITKMERTADYI